MFKTQVSGKTSHMRVTGFTVLNILWRHFYGLYNLTTGKNTSRIGFMKLRNAHSLSLASFSWSVLLLTTALDQECVRNLTLIVKSIYFVSTSSSILIITESSFFCTHVNITTLLIGENCGLH